jgi:phosphoribosylformylglycinamidine synthase I
MSAHDLTALVITAPGINCDGELAHAFEAAGARAERVLLSTLARDPSRIARADLIGLPGGFSFGDDIAAGRIMGALMRREVYPALRDAAARGVPMICPCNGFQIAVQAGLLPGPASAGSARAGSVRTSGAGNAAWPDDAAPASVALLQNQGARFVDRWTRVEIPAATVCVWTHGIACEAPDDMLPSAHGEGRFFTDAATMAQLEAGGQIALRYSRDENFNGSMGAVAGICDPSGVVFGLMPHPERWTRWTQHPTWTRIPADQRQREPLGLRMFRQAVQWARTRELAPAARVPAAARG